MLLNTDDLPESARDNDEYSGLYDDPHDEYGLYSNPAAKKTKETETTKGQHSGQTPIADTDVGLYKPQIEAVDTEQAQDDDE